MYKRIYQTITQLLLPLSLLFGLIGFNSAVFAAQVNTTQSTIVSATGSGATGIPSINNFNIPAGKNRILFIFFAAERDHCDQTTDSCYLATDTASVTGLSDNFARPDINTYQITARVSSGVTTIDKKNALVVGGTPSGDLRFSQVETHLRDASLVDIPNSILFTQETYHIALFESEINQLLNNVSSGTVNISLPDVTSPKSTGDDAILMAVVFQNVDQSVNGIVRSAVPMLVGGGAGIAGDSVVTASSLDAGQAPNDSNDSLFIVGVSSLGQPTHTGGFNLMSGYTAIQAVTTNNSNGRYDNSEPTWVNSEPDGLSLSAQFSNGTASSFSLQSAASNSTLLFSLSAPAFTLSSDLVDSSDAPSSYGTSSHAISGIRLGSTADDNDTNLSSNDALGDDLNGSDDEDGVTLPASLTAGITGQTASVDIQSAAGYLNVWADWNQDGDFLDSGEQLAQDQAVNTGTTSIGLNAPSTTDGTVFLRFRVCATTGTCNTPIGYASSGEVEDHTVVVTPDVPAQVCGGYHTTLYNPNTTLTDNGFDGWNLHYAINPIGSFEYTPFANTAQWMHINVQNWTSASVMTDGVGDDAGYSGVLLDDNDWDRSAAFTRKIAPGEAGNYRFNLLQGDDHVKIYKNGTLIYSLANAYGSVPLEIFSSYTLAEGDLLTVVVTEEHLINTTLQLEITPLFPSPCGTSTLSGVVFEDMNYGGGIGRDQTTAAGQGINGATVELYDSTGAFINSTTSANNGTEDGVYTFTNVTNGDYYVRVVSDSVNSTRAGSDGSELGVQTFRTNGITPVTNEIGGRYPTQADASIFSSGNTLNTTTFQFSGGSLNGQVAQSVTAVSVNSANVSDVDFGFNFNTIVNTNNTGQGSLRQFILNTNLLQNTGLAQVGLTAGVDTSIFEIAGAGPHLISPSTILPAITDSYTAIDATTQTGTDCTIATRQLTIGLYGTNAGANANGLTVNGDNALIRGLAIGRFTESAITASSTANNLTVVCNNLGLETDGTTAAQNNLYGLYVNGSSNLTVGGATTDTRNIVSNNQRDGMRIQNVNTATIENNYVGTDVSGLLARSNNQEGANYAGIMLNGNSRFVQVRNNLISGNDKMQSGSAVNTTKGIALNVANHITITANRIGTKPDGLSALVNSGYGIYINGTVTDTVIGGTTAAERNLISGNQQDGINTRFGTNRIQILGNYIGTDINGTAMIANRDNGIFLADTNNATIGDGTAAGRNIIAGNTISGIRNSSSPGTIIAGNYIGTDVTGLAPLGNTQHGIYVQNSANVAIGGSLAGQRNIIADNRVIGIFVVGTTSNTLIENNLVGLLVDGNTAAGNRQAGVETSDTDGVTLRNNVLSANLTRGAHLRNSPNTTMIGNKIGTDEAGLVARANGAAGVDVVTAAANLLVQDNTIAGNTQAGIRLTGGDATGGQILGNRIGVDQTGNADLGNTLDGILVDGTPNLSIGAATSTGRNIISGNNRHGILLNGANTQSITVTGNFIGLGANGTTALGNTEDGIQVNNATQITIGDGTSAGANLIAHNGTAGIGAVNSANQVTISANSLFNNQGLGIDLNADEVTVNDASDTDTGPNTVLNFPQLRSAALVNGHLTVKGCAPSGATLELFEADVSPTSPSGVSAGANQFGKNQDYGEGETYITRFVEGTDEDTVTTPVDCASFVDNDNNSASGLASFQWTMPLPSGLALGDKITMTATSSSAGTSEFSAAQAILNQNDYGDAPSSYGQPYHTINEGIYLGAAPPDAEPAATHSPGADGDDNTGDDEDGITLPSLQQGTRTTLSVTVTGTAYLQGWIDWNGNGSFEANEKVAPNLQDNATGDLNPTVGVLEFAVHVPSYATTSTTYARLRWSSTANLDATSTAPDGEVEDYAITISSAPASSTSACIAHVYGGGSGSSFNWPGTNSTVTVNTNLSWSTTSTAISFYDYNRVTRSLTGTQRWQKTADETLTLNFSPAIPASEILLYINDIGFNANSSYNPSLTMTVSGGATASDFTMQPVDNGFKTLAYIAATGTILKQVTNSGEREHGVLMGQGNQLVSQLTLSSSGISSGDLVAYVIAANLECDFGDAPDTAGSGPATNDYATLGSSNGPQHNVAQPPRLYMGSNVTTEADGLANSSAQGDTDNGVFIDSGLSQSLQNAVLTPEDQYILQIPITGSGQLYAWIDWDNNGVFGNTSAEIIAQGLNANNQTLTVTITPPLNVNSNSVFARFRLTDDTTTITPTGAVKNGEVEDYQFSVQPSSETPSQPAPVSCSSTWTATGANTYESTTAQGIKITATANASTNASWNIGPSDALNTAAVFSDMAVAGAPSLLTTFTWDTSPEHLRNNLATEDGQTGSLTFSFDHPVRDPVLHIDRLGGYGGSTDATPIALSNTAVIQLNASHNGLSFNRLAGTDHFELSGNAVQRQLNQTMVWGESVSQSGTDGTRYTASGSVGLTGVFNNLQLDFSGAGVEGAGADGIEFVVCAEPVRDYGDAPAYPDASHFLVNNTYLGTAPTAESSSKTSNGDASDDEQDDGLTSTTFYQGATTNLSIAVTGTGYLQAWVDWNADGDFADVKEQIALNLRDNVTGDTNPIAGHITFPVKAPANAASPTYLRLRWSSARDLDVGGNAPDGEVEDYQITITHGGFTVSGRVYHDNNVNQQDDTEIGLKGVTLVLYDQANNSCRSTKSDANGAYQFSQVPAAATDNYIVYEAGLESVNTPKQCPPNPADLNGYLSSTANSQVISVETANVTGIDFGDVKKPTFELENSQTTLPNTTVVYPHIFRAPTDGAANFSVSQAIAQPNTLDWATQIIEDVNCDGALNTGDAALPDLFQIHAGEEICLLVKVLAPANASAGATHTLTVTSTFTFAGAISLPPVIIHRTDITTTASGPSEEPASGEAKLDLAKSVWNVTRNGSGEVAVPGEVLRYTIRYENIGNGLLDELVINDSVPEFTQLVATPQCGSTPAELGSCQAYVDGLAIEWQFSGKLPAGASGQVSYEVRVE